MTRKIYPAVYTLFLATAVVVSGCTQKTPTPQTPQPNDVGLNSSIKWEAECPAPIIRRVSCWGNHCDICGY